MALSGVIRASSFAGIFTDQVLQVSSGSLGVSGQSVPLVAGGGGNPNWDDVTIGTRDTMNLSSTPNFAVSMSPGIDADNLINEPRTSDDGYEIVWWPEGTEAGTYVHNATGGWDNGPLLRLTPQAGPGAGESGLHISGLSQHTDLQCLNFGVAWRPGPAYAEYTDGSKFAIGEDSNTPGGSTDYRPMLFVRPCSGASNGAYNRSGTIHWTAGVNTTQQSDWTAAYASTTVDGWQGLSPFVVYADNTALNGIPAFDEDDWLWMEWKRQTIATATYPYGLVGFRVYTRAGDVYENLRRYQGLGAEDATLGSYISTVQCFGHGFRETPPSAIANNYVDMSGPILCSANNWDGWYGPPPGFVL